jgi:uncharacterized protein YbdZ (MbtH family)
MHLLLAQLPAGWQDVHECQNTSAAARVLGYQQP